MAEAGHVGQPPENNPFIESSHHSAEDDLYSTPRDEFTRKQAWCLYLSHFLSMWNSRSYEHAVVLFVQAAFPGTLLASSVNGVAETICVLLFSSALGRWVDRAPSRLRTLLLTINIDKCMVLVCSILWFFILSSDSLVYKRPLFAVALVLGMVEKLSRMTNTLSMERDWIPTLANPSMAGKWTPYELTQLNTTIRRIDMICKIGAPLVILEFLSYVGTHKVAVVVIAIISTVSWGVECRAATKIWKGNRRLQAPKRKESDELEMDELDTQSETHQYPEKPSIHQSTLARTIAYIEASYHTHMDGLRYYFSTDVYIPSICVAVLHASVLSYGGTFTTYLLNAGLTYNSLTYAKAVGSVFEIGSTILFPYAVTWLSSSRTKSVIDPDDPQGPKIIEVREHLLEGSSDGEGEATEETRQTQNPYLESGMIRVGLWGICGLFICLIPAIFSVFSLDAVAPTPSENPDAPALPSLMSTHTLLMLTLFLFLSFSFLGRWTYDLSTMQLTQVLIPATHRSNFGGTEMAVVSVFSMIHWVSALIWNRQSDFKWLAVGSFVGVGLATGLFWGWSRWWEKKEGRAQGQRRNHVKWADP